MSKLRDGWQKDLLWPTLDQIIDLRHPLERFPNWLNHLGFPKDRKSDSRCRLVKEASLHDETSFK